MGLIANVVGATGLVGQQLVHQLLNNREFEKVRIFVRRQTGNSNPKLEEHVIDFDQTESWAPLVQGDVLFSALGTTLKTAKSKENQYRVDFTYQFEFAKVAAANGIQSYILVSSMGANARSFVFYSRIKGELENAIALLDFKSSMIFRPSILDGGRQEKRAGEKIGLAVSGFVTTFMLKMYAPTPVDILAAKMIHSSLEPIDGYRIFEGQKIFYNDI